MKNFIKSHYNSVPLNAITYLNVQMSNIFKFDWRHLAKPDVLFFKNLVFSIIVIIQTFTELQI